MHVVAENLAVCAASDSIASSRLVDVMVNCIQPAAAVSKSHSNKEEGAASGALKIVVLLSAVCWVHGGALVLSAG